MVHEPENLDALDSGELRARAADYRKSCAKGDDEFNVTMKNLALYCDAIAQAKDWRAVGLVRSALGKERDADRLYQYLPDWARW